MKHRGKRAWIAVLALALLLGSCGTGAVAQESKSIGYAVHAILPDNQNDDKASYFSLNVSPGQEQVLQVLVLNREDEEIEVALEANAAFSNSNGVIVFPQTEERDPSLAVDFSQIAAPVEPVITVPARGETAAEFRIKMPDEPFDGVVMGGLVITKLNQNKDTDAQGAMAIQNVYQYVLGVRLRESDAAIEPEFELNGAELGMLAGFPTLILHLRNPRPIVARGIDLDLSIHPRDGGESTATYSATNIGMAPNTAMAYTVFLSNIGELDAGEYTVRAELRFEGRAWQLETPLSVN